MRVMVTGGLGAIGSFATRYLVEQGERPLVYDSRRDFLLLRDIADRFEFVQGDILDWPRLLRVAQEYHVDRIIHTAALMPPPCKDNPPQAVQVNVVGFTHVMEVARVLGMKRVVLASTKGVYDRMEGEYGYPTYKPVTEDYPKNPQSLYDATRFFCERYGLQYWENYGVDFVALRFASTYGPGKFTHGPLSLESQMVENALQGKETVIPHGGEEKTDLIYNRDTGRALVLACYAQGLKHRQFHIGTGRGYSLVELAETVRRLVPGASIRVGPGLDYRGLGVKSYCVFDISRARQELGFEPQYDLERGVRDYIELVRRLDYFRR